MALLSSYKQFLNSPNPASLADNASYNYITTLVTTNGSNDIVKHLRSQSGLLKKKEETILDVIEGESGLALEVDTTIEFVNGGGSYLPGLDDNFVSDHVVHLPIIHIVNFNSSGKITQVRLSWDQGSLLKQIDVIGKTGRNWPIRDGKDHVKLIVNSVKGADRPIATTSVASATTAPVEETQEEGLRRSRENSNNVTRDPHASLSLFAARSHEVQDSLPAVVAPRASAKPPPRDYHDLFVGKDENEPEAVSTPDKVRGRSMSPSKAEGAIAPKGGAGKNFQPSRIFDNDENSPIRPGQAKGDSFYRPNPKKYQHFDFSDGSEHVEDIKKDIPAENKSKHGTQWKFDDFNTPQKTVPSKVIKSQNQGISHWGNEDDVVLESPIMTKKVDKPRKDADTHFEFADDGTPEGGKRLIGRPRGAGMDSGMGLYTNNVYSEEGATPTQAPLGDVTNMKDRKKDVNSHFSLAMSSPAQKAPEVAKIPNENVARANKNMNASWANYDSSSPAVSQKENIGFNGTSPSRNGNAKSVLTENRNDHAAGINIGGDGMGGKRGAGRGWGFGDDEGW